MNRECTDESRNPFTEHDFTPDGLGPKCRRCGAGAPGRDMSKEEPAWKAELREELRIALGASNIENIYVRRRAHDAVFPSVVALIQAAEERGREAALREAADGFVADAERSTEPRRTEILCAVAYLLRDKADHVGPDKP